MTLDAMHDTARTAAFFLLFSLLVSLPALGQEADTTGGIPMGTAARPETPVEEWTSKTILLVGAHPDDDSGSYGTLSMLRDHGNEVYVMILTTGNVGTKDTTMTRDRLAKIRRQEELSALSVLGIPADHYINLGYTDGMLEFADRLSVLRRMVRHIRTIKPDVLFAFDPGYGYQVWHKTDHRAASYLAADAARMAEWRLLFPGQVVHEGLEKHWIQEYMLYGGLEKDRNTWVDISGYAEDKVQALGKHISQFSSAWHHYAGPDIEDLPEDEQETYLDDIRGYLEERDGHPVEGFRYYKGIPDGIGRRHP